MLYVVLVFCLLLVAFWRSLIKFLIAAILILLIVGGIQAVHAIDAIVTVNPQQQQIH